MRGLQPNIVPFSPPPANEPNRIEPQQTAMAFVIPAAAARPRRRSASSSAVAMLPPPAGLLVPPPIPPQQDLLSSAATSAATTFEPTVDPAALSSFAVIAVVFGLLQLRIGAVNAASARRREALVGLRAVKADQLFYVEGRGRGGGGGNNSSSASSPGKEGGKEGQEEDGGGTGITMTEAVEAALEEYEEALRDELELRRLAPGIRIVAPNDPGGEGGEDAAAARRFLGMDIGYDERGERTLVPLGTGGGGEEEEGGGGGRREGRSGRSGQEVEEGEGEVGEMSAVAKAVLLGVALTQIGLLYMLSFDPMKAATSSGSLF